MIKVNSFSVGAKHKKWLKYCEYEMNVFFHIQALVSSENALTVEWKIGHCLFQSCKNVENFHKTLFAQ